MTKPRLLLFYERLLPGSQLVNRLQDLGYQVQTVPSPDELPGLTATWLPLLIVADLESSRGDVPGAVRQIRANPQTAHVPVLAFHSSQTPQLAEQARDAGATLVVQDAAVLNHLPQLLNQALEVE